MKGKALPHSRVMGAIGTRIQISWLAAILFPLHFTAPSECEGLSPLQREMLLSQRRKHLLLNEKDLIFSGGE